MTPNFDPVARIYRWCEYLALGPFLSRARNHYIASLTTRRQALILGDGDGRFTSRLMASNPRLQATAIDLSIKMLALLRHYSQHQTVRLTTLQTDARNYIPTERHDLVVTHFFLDCLTQTELETLITNIVHTLTPGALWLVTDFRIPAGPLHWPARAYIRALYLIFRFLTNLEPQTLPDHTTALTRAGLQPIAIHRSLFGILTTELWQKG